jgi:hypothetical protein
MSQNDPFALIAENFPYQKALQLNTHDRAALTLALLENIQGRVNAGQDPDLYGFQAARHILFLEKDFGLGYAVAYWENVRKIPKVRLNESFFKAPGIQTLVREIILSTQDEVQ